MGSDQIADRYQRRRGNYVVNWGNAKYGQNPEPRRQGAVLAHRTAAARRRARHGIGAHHRRHGDDAADVGGAQGAGCPPTTTGGATFMNDDGVFRFHTLLTPNTSAPDIIEGGWFTPTGDPLMPATAGAENAQVAAARSRHTGGVNAAMCDASVRFFRNDIDAGRVAGLRDRWTAARRRPPSDSAGRRRCRVDATLARAACRCVVRRAAPSRPRAASSASSQSTASRRKMGSISFFPVDGRGTTAGGEIVDGQVLRRGGARRSEGRDSRAEGRRREEALRRRRTAASSRLMAETLPARYNDQTELRLDVTPGENPQGLRAGRRSDCGDDSAPGISDRAADWRHGAGVGGRRRGRASTSAR